MRMIFARGGLAAATLFVATAASATTYPPCTASRQDECVQVQPGASHHQARVTPHMTHRAER